MKLVLSAALAAATAAISATTASAADPPPNVVMLFVDDLGYGDTGFNGHPTTKTPNIDKLAHEGKILSTWYSGCPVCSGSRAALMTGRQYVPAHACSFVRVRSQFRNRGAMPTACTYL